MKREYSLDFVPGLLLRLPSRHRQDAHPAHLVSNNDDAQFGDLRNHVEAFDLGQAVEAWRHRLVQRLLAEYLALGESGWEILQVGVEDDVSKEMNILFVRLE